MILSVFASLLVVVYSEGADMVRASRTIGEVWVDQNHFLFCALWRCCCSTSTLVSHAALSACLVFVKGMEVNELRVVITIRVRRVLLASETNDS
jgi:hypothetical protein